MKTGLHCTNCKAEFELDATVILKDTGFVSLTGIGNAIVIANDSPYIEQLCEDCGALLQVKENRPNRVVVEVEGKNVLFMSAERPEELVVIVHDKEKGHSWDRTHTVRKLCTMKEEA